MRAILVRPDQPESPVEVIDYDGDYKSIYKLISYENHPVICFDCVEIDASHVLFVDDEGLLHNPEHFMVWDDYDQPLAGRGLILGYDEDGESVDCKLEEDWVREKVTCMDIERVRRYME